MDIAQRNAPHAYEPLARHLLFQTIDAVEARERVAKIYCPHDLKIVGPDRCFVDTSMSRVELGGVSLNRLRYGPTVKIDVGCLGTFFLIMMPMVGTAHVSCGDQTLCASPDQAAVVSPTLPFYQTINANCNQIMVQVDRSLLERICAQHVGHDLREPVRFRLDLAMSSHHANGFLAFVSHLLNELDSQAPYLKSQLVRASIEHLIVVTLLHAQWSNYSEELTRPAPSVAPSHVKRVEEYIKAHAAEPLTIASLADFAGVSASSLYTGFREFRKTTPMAYLRSERLQRVRNELLQATSATTTVADVAARWGFLHLGHFATYYKKKFGELPSDTLRKQ